MPGPQPYNRRLLKPNVLGYAPFGEGGEGSEVTPDGPLYLRTTTDTVPKGGARKKKKSLVKKKKSIVKKKKSLVKKKKSLVKKKKSTLKKKKPKRKKSTLKKKKPKRKTTRR
jgi:hypothetical protein